jgi:predicted nucleic-acid-binding Zn-ribbon protein
VPTLSDFLSKALMLSNFFNLNAFPTMIKHPGLDVSLLFDVTLKTFLSIACPNFHL